MVIKLVRGWRCFRAGHVFDGMGDGMANVLIDRGLAVEVSGGINATGSQGDRVLVESGVRTADLGGSQVASAPRRRQR